MAEFTNLSWQNAQNIGSKSFVCWNCSNLVASHTGYNTTTLNGSYAKIYICPHCKAPHIVDFYGAEYPYIIQGKEIKNLPENIKNIFNEARTCFGAGAYTATVMLLRKIMMNLAVEEGASSDSNMGFSAYVKYLCDNGVVHKKQHQQAEKIKQLGNDANHKIEERSKEDATLILGLISLILVNNYEHADDLVITKEK